ncbi:MAG: hemerythrin domain-containing protein [Gammaproteobacteria bacterium]|nr:hemerythrin domain-containing protein [Gammaproteobacteria bacterium]MDH3448752.1 hemerythrin domain-containing protein [Gammaproteobacteria bacterium]
MRAIAIIKSEHKNLGAVLYSLEKLIEEIDKGKHPDFTIFHGLLTYLDRFLDRYHHPKENLYLFPKLLERAPDTEALVRELGQQHTEGELLFIEMLKALSAYEFSGAAEFPHFRETVLKYTEFERNHAHKEEKEILPRAKKALQASDWEEIDAAFGENRDPMFGQDWNDEFSELFDSIVNRLPAPLGLGDDWK